MVDTFNEWEWIYNEDRTVRRRTMRVLDHYNVDYWDVAGSLTFVTKRLDVVEDVEVAVEGYDATLEQVADEAGFYRYRVKHE